MNKRTTETQEEVPNNLPFEGEVPEKEKNNKKEDTNISFSISKKSLKRASQIIIIIIILIVAMPRIINNVKSTTEVISSSTEQFSTIFPSLTSTGTGIVSFLYNGTKNIAGFVTGNLANMAELLYSRKVSPTTNINITSDEITEETAMPIRLIISKIGVDTPILNPNSTDIKVLDEKLKYGAVRYPKSGLLGEKDNIYIFGHSTSYKIVRNKAYKALNHLNYLKIGDIIKIQSENKEYLYSVTSVKTEKDTNAVVKFNTGEKTLTISTCNTLGAKEDRFIVRADFITSYPLSNLTLNSGNTTTISNNTIPASNEHTLTKPTENNNQGATTLTPGKEVIKTIPIPTGGISDPNGQADLIPEITEIGILDPETNEFIASSTPSSKSKIAFKFTISNQGTKTAEAWRFNAVLPTDPVYIYSANDQKPLKPGEKIEYAMGFDRAKAGDNMAIIINVNPAGSTNESNKANNIVKKFITIAE